MSGLTAFAKPQPKKLSVKLHEKGKRFAGIVAADPVLVQQTVYKGKPGELAFWTDGNPKMQWQMTLLVIHEDICKCEAWCQEGRKNLINGTDADSGVRNMYVPASGNLFTAMVTALEESETPREDGSPVIEVGGAFVFARTGLDYEKAEKTGGKPPATFKVLYKMPTPEWQQRVKEYVATRPVAGQVPTHDGSPSMAPADLNDLLTIGLAKEEESAGLKAADPMISAAGLRAAEPAKAAEAPKPGLAGTTAAEAPKPGLAGTTAAEAPKPGLAGTTAAEAPKPGPTVFEPKNADKAISFDSLLADLGE